MKVIKIILMLVFSLLTYAQISFEKRNLDVTGNGNVGIYATKVDSDNYSDIITVAPGKLQLQWYQNVVDKAKGFTQTFVKKIIDSDVDGQYLDCEDINGDQIPDIVLSVPSDNNNIGHIYLYKSYIENDVIKWNKESVTDNFLGAHQVHFVDMDNDGDKDILGAAIGAGEIKWWENVSSSWPGHLIAENYEAQAVEYCDFNNDGFPDIVSGLMVYQQSGMNIWFSSFSDSLSYEKTTLNNPVSGCHWFQIADMNNDGLKDIVCTGYFSCNIAIWERNSADDLTFTRKIPVPNIQYPLHVAVCDLDNDGDLDLLAPPHNGNNHQFTYYLKDGENYTGTVFQNFFNASWQIIPFDADNDGDLDLVCGGFHFPNPSLSETLHFYRNSLITGIKNEKFSEKSSILLNNYPNPFNPSTTIKYQLNLAGEVSLIIFNSCGRTVLEKNLGFKTAGTFNYSFNGKILQSGVYFCRLIVNNNYESTLKLNLIK